MLENLFVKVLEATFVIGIVIVALMLLSTLLNRLYAAKWRYFLWIILAIRLVIPFDLLLPSPVLQINVPNISVAEVQTTVQEGTTAFVAPNTVPNEAVPQNSLTLMNLLAILWLSGMVVFILVQLVGYFYFKKQVWRWNRPIASPKIHDCMQLLSFQMFIDTEVPTFINEKISGPMMMGLLRPTLLLPREDYTDADLSFIIQHELIHYKRHDLWYKLLLVAANAVHWFNPLVYLMVQEANRDLELSCDDEVTKGKTTDERKAYSQTILSAIHFGKTRQIAFTTYFYGGTRTMKERFINIFDIRKKRSGILAVAVVLATILLSGTLVGFTLAKSPKATDASSSSSIVDITGASPVENIHFTITDCNVTIKTLSAAVISPSSNSNGFKYEIDEAVQKLTATENGSTMNIELVSTDKLSEKPTPQRTIIYIPEQQYKKITVVGNSAGISVPALNADFEITNNMGAVSISVSKGFDKSIDFKSIEGSGSLVLSPTADNYTINMTANTSAVSVPKEFPVYVFQPRYEYVKGLGAAKINLDLQGSAFAIAISNKADSKMNTITIKDKVYYYVDSEEHLRLIGSDSYPLSANYMLSADINLTQPWLPIGISDDAPFTGSFNGNGFTISNVFIDNPKGDYKYLGFFGLVSGGTIHNVALENVSIKVGDKTDAATGAIAAVVINGSKVTDCTVK